MPKSHVLLLGGTGFIGRNIVYYWLKEKKVESIVVVDLLSPELAWMTQEHRDAYNDRKVQYKKANLIFPEECTEVFERLGDAPKFDVVVNCAGVTKPGQAESVYKKNIFRVSLNCAREAAMRKIRFIELSSGNMNSLGRMHRECDPVDPWTSVAKWKRKVEEELAKVPNLEYTILRLPIVYGKGDLNGLMPRILEAAVYKRLGGSMKLRGSADTRIHTVHVHDVTRAIFNVRARDDTKGEIFNVVDYDDSSQGSIWKILCSLFGIKVDFTGDLMSRLSDVTMAAEQANERIMATWDEVMKEEDMYTPLSPHIYPEQLISNHLR
ncbi:unnamed protein product [Acanthoscelides obtectus]|nr:unnamed protein product [Acanthoscelides obtectus]CAK1666712.1 hypothetical protein AOBTE_LOCUS25445 [Acanthoscelides obtectus]